MSESKRKLVIVTGLSGSGKSIALHALEDVGYYCIDNLPVSLLTPFSAELLEGRDPVYGRTAVGIDARNQAISLREVPRVTQRLREGGVDCEILFLVASNEALIQRFSETRRRHPLTDDSHNLEDAIMMERGLLEPMLSSAALMIDTSRTTLHQLRELVRDRVGERASGQMSLMFESFGFKYGAPRNADFVFDVRCLPNPHWQAELRPLTGRDEPVEKFLKADERVGRMLKQIADYLHEWLPCFQQEGRSYLTVALGCTGGQHRSVYMAEQLSRRFDQAGVKIITTHRELA